MHFAWWITPETIFEIPFSSPFRTYSCLFPSQKWDFPTRWVRWPWTRGFLECLTVRLCGIAMRTSMGVFGRYCCFFVVSCRFLRCILYLCCAFNEKKRWIVFLVHSLWSSTAVDIFWDDWPLWRQRLSWRVINKSSSFSPSKCVHFLGEFILTVSLFSKTFRPGYGSCAHRGNQHLWILLPKQT